jgi:RNA polymerase sigma factor (sigma-70 family)
MSQFDEAILLRELNDAKTRERAFKTLINSYQERLYWHIRGMVLIHEDADDVLQNTFIKIFRYIHTFKGQSKLYTWMYRIATNEALSHLNQSKKIMGKSLDDLETNLSKRLKADPYFDATQVEDNLGEMLSRLPDQQRIIFSMKYFQDMKLKEIAQVLNLSLGGVKSSYHLAQKKIKTMLQHQTF